MRFVNGAAVALAAGGVIAIPALGDTVHSAPGGHGAPGGGATRSFPISDTFDSYAPGIFPCTGGACAGPNGWSVWYSGGGSAQIVSGGAHSGSNSMEMAAGSDIVQTGAATAGVWEVKAHLFSPTSDAGLVYFIVMNAYNGVPGTNTWSIEVQFNGATGQIRDDINGVYPAPAANTGPVIGTMVRDQWAEVRAVIDLSANRYNLFYNGTQIITNQVFTPPGSPYATAGIAAIDLYSDTSAGSRYDTFSVQPVGSACYPNCDQSTALPFLNVQDFTCFLQKYAGADAYANCDSSTTPPALNVQDFTCFLQKFAAGCSAP